MELTNFFPAHTENFMPIRVPNRILRIGSPIFQSEDFGPTWWVGGVGYGTGARNQSAVLDPPACARYDQAN